MGIASIDNLLDFGAVRAFAKMQTVYNDNLKLDLLWKLFGATQNTHWSLITTEQKQQLLLHLKDHQCLRK